MKDLKIRVNNEAESKEAQELFFELGYKWFSGGNQVQHLKQSCSSSFGYLVAWSSGCFTDVIQCGCGNEDAKKITLPELRDLVVLKRNDVGDANAFRHDNDVKYYITSDNKYYYFSDIPTFQWTESCNDIDYLEKHVKPIEKKEMKEYLRKNSNNTYSYIGTVRPEHVSDFMIEIPEGRNIAVIEDSKVKFYSKYTSADLDHLGKDLIWMRPSHPEELPFIDDEPSQSLNDQYAEIETVRQTLNQRQEQYGSFEDVAMITEQMVDVMRKGYYENLAYNQKMALYMICSKMARIVNGNPNRKDSWHDIAGYATLIDNELESEKDMTF